MPRLQSGQKSPFLNNLAVCNRVIAAADAYHEQGGRPTAPTIGNQSTDCVLVKNITGSNLLRGHCVQLGDYALSAINPNALWFSADDPADPVTERYAILRQPVASGDTGYWLAQVSGVCTALVDVTDTGHHFATPASGSNVLDSAASGPIELLQLAGSTGEQELCVRLASVTTGVLIIEFTITAVGPPIEADVDVRPDGFTTVPGETGGEVELVDPHGLDIEVDMTGSAWYVGGEWRILNLTCPP